MHIDSASLLTNMALVAVGISAVGFLLWFLIALTMEKNGAHVRCHMEFKIDDASTVKMGRRSIREVAAPRLRPEELESAQPAFRPAHILVTHRALRAVGQTAKVDLANESWQAGPYLIQRGR